MSWPDSEDEEHESKFDPGSMAGEVERDEKGFLEKTSDFYWDDMAPVERLATAVVVVISSGVGTALLTTELFPEFDETAGDFVEDPVDSSIGAVEYLLEEGNELGEQVTYQVAEYSGDILGYASDPEVIKEAQKYAVEIASSLY